MDDHEHEPYLTKRGVFCVICDVRIIVHPADNEN